MGTFLSFFMSNRKGNDLTFVFCYAFVVFRATQIQMIVDEHNI